MALCRNCGAKSKRYNSGGAWATHPCECGASTSNRGLETVDHRSAEAIRGDFCRPTNCPRCRQRVYFVKHNGGSVFFDELGWPWPKHGCFISDPSDSFNWSNLNHSSIVGIVISVDSYNSRLNRLCVLLESKIELSYFVKKSCPVKNIVGNIIIVNGVGRKIVDPADLQNFVERQYADRTEPVNLLVHTRLQSKNTNNSNIEKVDFRCNYCTQSMIFSNEYALDLHIWEKHHGMTSQKSGARWNCKICSASFFTIIGLDAHKKTHETE